VFKPSTNFIQFTRRPLGITIQLYLFSVFEELQRVNANFTAVPGLRAEERRAFPEYSIADEFTG
jgi:hypothetical protein